MQKESWHRDQVRLIQVDFDDRSGKQEGIVGLWQAIQVAKGNIGIPDGTVIDQGFQQWHADGTELLNSSRMPVTGNYCMGTWEKVGPSTYALNHFGIGFDTSNNFAGNGNIREEVVLNHDGTKFEGVFTVDIFDIFGNRVQHIKGTVTGKRIGINTQNSDLQ